MKHLGRLSLSFIAAMLLSCNDSRQSVVGPQPHLISCEQIRAYSALELDWTSVSNARAFSVWASTAKGLAGLAAESTTTEAGDDVDISLPNGGLVGGFFGKDMRRHVTFLTQKAISIDLVDVIGCFGPPDFYLLTGPTRPTENVGVEAELYYTSLGIIVTALKIPSTASIVATDAMGHLPVISIVRLPSGQVADFYANYYWRSFGGRTGLLRHVKPWPGDILKMDIVTAF
ncbi:MAG: hypothetical protein ABIV92_03835 [Thermoflexales bacterium]